MKRSKKFPIFLAASPVLMDPHFSRAVILLLEHDAEGALGFVINNKSSMTVSEVVAFNQMEIPSGIPVWNAGPIDSSSGFILHNRPLDEFEQEIAPGVCLSASQDSLKKLIVEAHGTSFHLKPAPTREHKRDVLYPYRLLIGYAGWGPGQLDEELKEGTWIQAPLNLEILFNAGHSDIWHLTLESIGIKQSAHLAPAHRQWLH